MGEPWKPVPDNRKEVVDIVPASVYILSLIMVKFP
jgi:hypothetical protein